VLNDDESLAPLKVEHHLVRPYQLYKWPFDDQMLIDETALCKAIVSLHSQGSEGEECKNLRCKKFVMTLLLKVASQMKWAQLDGQDPVLKEFTQILIQISQQSEIRADQSADKWEADLIESWEHVIDSRALHSAQFFIPRLELTPEEQELLSPQKRKQSEVKQEQKIV
jgi:hypothetical protein